MNRRTSKAKAASKFHGARWRHQHHDLLSRAKHVKAGTRSIRTFARHLDNAVRRATQ